MHYERYSTNQSKNRTSSKRKNHEKIEDKRKRICYFRTIKISLTVCVVLFFIFSCIYVSWAMIQKRVHQENFIYRKTSLADQTPVDTLFSQKEDDNWQLQECLQKLHLEEYNSIGAEITEESLNYCNNIIQSTYKNGQKPTQPPISLNAEQKQHLQTIRKEVIAFCADTSEDYITEAEKWNTLYQYSNRPVDLYHSGRALVDALEVGTRNFEEIFPRSAEAVNRLETFLTFENRNINNSENPIYKNADYISFLSGKVYYQLAQSSMIGNAEERCFTNCLLMLSYSCMIHAKNEMSQEHKDYAIVVYYIGYIGEQMLKKIPKGTDFYLKIGKTSFQNYSEASALLETGPEYYRQESSMKKNISNGLEALKGFNN